MKRYRHAASLAAVCIGLAWQVAAGNANAALHARDGGMVYDDEFNITWLADMNYAKTSGYSKDGRLDWVRATQWAADLSYGGYSDWRLPTLNPTDTTCTDSGINGGGFNCSGGELSHLFVADLGNLAQATPDDDAPPPTAEQLANFALFSNAQSYIYWSGTLANDVYNSYAWFFAANSGDQYYDFKSRPAFAVAVRDGDVAVPVPEPGTFALGLSGVAVLLARRWSGRRAAGWQRGGHRRLLPASLLRAAVAGLLTTLVSHAMAAPLVWASDQGGNGHAYEYVADALDWSSARVAARDRQFGSVEGHLATITSQAENNLLAQLGDDGWLGGSDAGTEGVWTWVEGPEAGQVFWQGGVDGTSLGYVAWTPNNPNDQYGREDSLHLFFAGWNDFDGGGTRAGYFVEYELGGVPSVPEPSAFSFLGAGLLTLIRRWPWRRAPDND